MKMSPVVHFELPYQDRDRVMEFYTKAFGWQSQNLGPDMGNYVVVNTTKTDPETTRPTEPGNINGGMFEKTKENQHPTIVIGVDDIHEATKQVEAAGGKVLGGAFKPGEPDDIPGVGLYSAFEDSEGNRIAMLQPKGM